MSTSTMVDSDRMDDDHVDQVTYSENKHRRRWQKTYGFLGFRKGYNFPLFIIFAGAMFGFCLARTEYWSITNYIAGAAPGQWYTFDADPYRTALVIHLATSVPAGLLLVWQFVPIIRHKFILFHRINGYIVLILLLFAVASALVLARQAFGGYLATSTWVGFLAILVLGGLGMAMYNIKRLQIDQHRAWMLRTMFYAGSIITVRLIMIIAAAMLPAAGTFATTIPCGELNSILSAEQLAKMYPECTNGSTLNGQAAVTADFTGSVAGVAAALNIGFEMGGWLSTFLHALGVEIYLALTPAEAARLRQVSYEKQLAAGMKNPGSSGLTADRWGDAEKWVPQSAVEKQQTMEV